MPNSVLLGAFPPRRQIAVHHLRLLKVQFGLAAIYDIDQLLWEAWLSQQGVPIELRKTWRYGGEALFFRDSDGHQLEVVTPGVWSIY